jgi:hypothetical protein
MNTPRFSWPSVLCVISVVCFFMGCGVNQEKLDDAQQRLDALEAKGVPDSMLSDARFYLIQAKGALKANNRANANKYADSMEILLQKAEAETDAAAQSQKPVIDSMVNAFKKQKENLSGLHLTAADSMLAIIDSLVVSNRLYQAKEACEELDTMMKVLMEDQEKAEEIEKKVAGRWMDTRVPEDKSLTAVEKKQFYFNKDGTIKIIEEMKGKTSEYTKENWKFMSWGTWKMKGDTAMIFITREKCPYQVYWNYQEKDGKRQWVKNEAATYDTTITDGSKNRYMTYEFIKENLSKK